MLVLYKKKTAVVLHRKKMSFMLHMIMMYDESQQRLAIKPENYANETIVNKVIMVGHQ